MEFTTLIVKSVILVSFLSSQGSSRYHVNVAVMETHPMGNEIAAWDLELQGPMKEHNVRDHEHSKPTDEMIIDAGYPAETHTVVTDDGYILTLHRIPHDAGGTYNRTRPVVFLQHGLLSSSADWVVTGPGKALAFLLSDQGYDVWMGNYRGNTYSHRHVNKNIDKKTYWTFTWDEMAEHDLPTMLSHMMEVTGQDTFYYIGHSMGTLTYYTACNYHHWIQNATRLMVGYGAHTAVPHITSPVFKLLAYFAKNLQWISDNFGVDKFLPSNWLIQWWASEVCTVEMISQRICGNVLFLVGGYNKNEMNNTMLPYLLGHVPAGTSVRNMLHYGQSVNTGAWAGYDCGSDQLNLRRWNSTRPPTYKYDVITAPVALFWGENDWLVVPEDEAALAGKLPNLVLNQRVDEDAYTHLDFLWGMHNMEKVYGPTMELMEKY
eukprot:GFUD01027196.1.p1 GENE.GFUD01027196.1~~GFUD01027196.1.p1  ORF type:complete len:433 (+),score=105.33 GFUD01027196.1:337-1635(+)